MYPRLLQTINRDVRSALNRRTLDRDLKERSKNARETFEWESVSRRSSPQPRSKRCYSVEPGPAIGFVRTRIVRLYPRLNHTC